MRNISGRGRCEFEAHPMNTKYWNHEVGWRWEYNRNKISVICLPRQLSYFIRLFSSVGRATDWKSVGTSSILVGATEIKCLCRITGLFHLTCNEETKVNREFESLHRLGKKNGGMSEVGHLGGLIRHSESLVGSSPTPATVLWNWYNYCTFYW